MHLSRFFLARSFLIASLLGVGLSLAMVSLTLAPTAVALAQPAEPDITVRQEQDRTIREYRLNDRLYAIEIRPAQGTGFFLVDHDGNGNFERQEGSQVDVPQWVLAP